MDMQFLESIVLLDCLTVYAVGFHVTDKLHGNFFKHLLGKVTSANSIVEAYELDDITLSNLCWVAEAFTVPVKLFHSIKVSITDANNND